MKKLKTKDKIKQGLQESIEINNCIIKDQIGLLEKIVQVVVKAFRRKKKIVFFGNGGSAADAQHLVAEFVCRFKKDRISLPAVALTTNTSLLTAIGNDMGFESIFSRQIEALVNAGDVVVGISTSGNSPNVLKGIKCAKEKGAITIAFTGSKGRKLSKLADFCFTVPSPDVPRIQEFHIMVGHIICELVEDIMF
ncbi:D-sedoheptulose 7-phosphate isomerase [bacterium]|nr:D-sedoheptulose 7-phosphate isomerase [bacterium]